ncbi:MAG: hypothetical protein US70_C0005G0041 [Parcubacteria group bacterium GW2011_GWD2_38_11]|nr:MAG: hypothetical protein US70_C0005G0041 [Parcubacteria group bacterium GW2011_GWD2_38_11]
MFVIRRIKKMNKKQIKKVVAKNVKKAQVKGAVIKKAVQKNVQKAQTSGAELQKMALKEYDKIKKQMDATSKKVESYVKKNPAKAAAISAGIGMALGAVAGILAAGGKKNKKK